jgi:hypothetical protein
MCRIFRLVGKRSPRLAERSAWARGQCLIAAGTMKASNSFCCLLTLIPVLASARRLELAGLVHEPRGGLGGTRWA